MVGRKLEEYKVKSIWSGVDLLAVINEKHAFKIWNYLIVNPDCLSLQDLPWKKFGLSDKNVEILLKDFVLCTTTVSEVFESDRNDGDTIKLLIELIDGHRIETVIMKHHKRVTVCLSSQVGCAMGCRFCATGTMGIIGDLTAAEIIEQLFHAHRRCAVRNVVFMGMGEPLNNYEQVKASVDFMVDNRLFALSCKHVTVSTVGVVKNMRKLADHFPNVNLAVSLHAPNQELRKRIIPTAGANPLPSIMEAITYHIDTNCKNNKQETTETTATETTTSNNKTENPANTVESAAAADDADINEINESQPCATQSYQLAKRKLGHQGVMIEYILIADVNDQPEVAHQLGALLLPLREYILLNLIPYNPTEVKETFQAPTAEAVERFRSICMSEQYQIHTRCRQEYGQDVNAACGQLALKTRKNNATTTTGTTTEIEDMNKLPAQHKNNKNDNNKTVFRSKTNTSYVKNKQPPQQQRSSSNSVSSESSSLRTTTTATTVTTALSASLVLSCAIGGAMLLTALLVERKR